MKFGRSAVFFLFEIDNAVGEMPEGSLWWLQRLEVKVTTAWGNSASSNLRTSHFDALDFLNYNDLWGNNQ
jgi:hypothetical protein